MASVARSASHRARSLSQSRSLQTTKPRHAIMMPYLSPLMTEGAISAWKKKEGDAFLAGDVLVSIASDFHEVDVRAVSSGILSKILVPDGSQGVKVEEVIALVAQDATELAAMRASANATSGTKGSSSSPPKSPTLPALSPSPRPPTVPSRFEQPSSPLSTTVHRTQTTNFTPESRTMQATAALHMRSTSSSSSGSPPRSSVNADDGSAIRRMMRDKFASHERKTSTPSTVLSSSATQTNKCTTSAYFDGIL
ncbi:single hybrid motif-containing protein [Flagelloscypha sp. PMI_526]|nr:single hybrid motif-containing protein [Flagelloscypha sp. PMI_526]